MDVGGGLEEEGGVFNRQDAACAGRQSSSTCRASPRGLLAGQRFP